MFPRNIKQLLFFRFIYSNTLRFKNPEWDNNNLVVNIPRNSFLCKKKDIKLLFLNNEKYI